MPRPPIVDVVDVRRQRLSGVDAGASRLLHAGDPLVGGLARLVTALRAFPLAGDRVDPPHPSPVARAVGSLVHFDVDGEPHDEGRELQAASSHVPTVAPTSTVERISSVSCEIAAIFPSHNVPMRLDHS